MNTIRHSELFSTWPSRFVLWIAIVSQITFWLSTRPLAAQTTGSQSFQPLTVVGGTPRPTDEDVVFLANGETLRGRITDDSLTLHTSYGSILFQTAWLAEIAIDGKPGHIDRIKTINRNRFSGFLNEPIEFEAASGRTFQWNKHAIDRIVFRQRTNEADHGATRRFVVLENGDLLSGQLLNWRTSPPDGTSAPVGLEDTEQVQFVTGTRSLQILLRNGRETTASLEEDTLRIELDLGPRLILPVSHVKTLYLRKGRLPPEVRREFEAASPVATGVSSEPPASTPEGMVWIRPGRFQLGSYPAEKGHGPDEDPPTDVLIPRGFWMGRHEVTQAEYLEITGTNPSGFQGQDNHPVEKVTWNEAVAYCAKQTLLAREEGRLPTGFVYRLPTEAEWEYACRAGSTTRFHFGDDPTAIELRRYAWFINSSDSSTHPVGQLKPNAWGLYDMHGNVWEWCKDVWQDAYPGGTVTNYIGSTDGWLRVARGGSWLYDAAFCRSANRDSYGPDNRSSDNGFRVVLAPPVSPR